MKNLSGYLILGMIIILILSTTGCVAPPAEQQDKPGSNLTAGQLSSTVTLVSTTPPIYVTVETPYVTIAPSSGSNTTNSNGYHTFPSQTQIPEDYVVVYSIRNQPFAYNKSAISFDLKNPPLIIDINLSVTKTTRTVEGDSRALSNQWTSYNVEDFDPKAYFEVTVREKATGKIVLQDGFGQSKQYGSENSRQLKIRTRGNYLVEFDGNKVAANINLSVKREGNIN